VDTFSVPFRFSNGLAAKHAEGSDEYYIHIMTMVLLTEPGQLPLNPEFGTQDPTFEYINRASLIELAAKYVPEINVTKITPLITDDGEEDILVEYDLD